MPPPLPPLRPQADLLPGPSEPIDLTERLLGTVPTEEPIPSGFTDVWVSYDFRLTEFEERYDLYVTIDDDGSGEGLIEEVDEENNTAFLLDVGCSVMALVTNPATLTTFAHTVVIPAKAGIQ